MPDTKTPTTPSPISGFGEGVRGVKARSGKVRNDKISNLNYGRNTEAEYNKEKAKPYGR
jgi:hypothetical protein